MKRLVVAIAAVAVVAVAALIAVDGARDDARGGEAEVRAVAPGLANDTPHTRTRSYGLGFFFASPDPTVEGAIEHGRQMALNGEYVLIQRDVPWSALAAGLTLEEAYEDEYRALVAYLRGVGLRIMLLTDPLDGLNRREESVEAKKNGKTLKDTATRATHEAWVRLLAEKVQPDYFGFASEINTLAGHGDYALYEVIRDMANRLHADVKRLSPKTKTFVSFQVDDAWDRFGLGGTVDHFSLPAEFDVDVIGLSSYPSFVFREPADIPDDYFRRMFFAGGGRPVLLAEGGWTSGDTPQGPSSEAKQAAYYRRLFDLLDGVQAEAAILLLLADIDFSRPGLGLTPEQAATLTSFGKMGITSSAYEPKAAWAVWDARRKLPWANKPR